MGSCPQEVRRLSHQSTDSSQTLFGWKPDNLLKQPAIKSLLQFEVCGDQCSVLELLTVTDTRYPTTAGKAT